MNENEGKKDASIPRGLADFLTKTRVVAAAMLFLSTILWWHQLNVGGNVVIVLYLAGLVAGIGLLFLQRWAVVILAFRAFIMLMVVFQGPKGNPQPGYESRAITMLLSAILDTITITILVILKKIHEKSNKAADAMR